MTAWDVTLPLLLTVTLASAWYLVTRWRCVRDGHTWQATEAGMRCAHCRTPIRRFAPSEKKADDAMTFYATFHSGSDYAGFYVPIVAVSLPAASAVIRSVYDQHVEQVYTAEDWYEGGASIAERHGLIELPKLSQERVA